MHPEHRWQFESARQRQWVATTLDQKVEAQEMLPARTGLNEVHPCWWEWCEAVVKPTPFILYTRRRSLSKAEHLDHGWQFESVRRRQWPGSLPVE